MTNPLPQTSAEAPKGGEASAPARKATGLVRWWMLAVVLGGGAAFAFVGAGPVARWAIERAGSRALGAPVTVEAAAFRPLSLELAFGNVVAKDRAAPERDLFSAKEAVARIAVGEALRGRLVVDEMRVTGARVRVVRNADGTINVGQQGEGPPPGPGEPGGPPAPPPGTSPDDPAWRRKIEEIAKERDLVEDLKELLRHWKERRDREVAKRREEAERRRRLGVGDPDARAEWVRPERPLLLVRRLVAESATIVIEDRAAGEPPREIADATIEIRNFSTAPWLIEEPMEVEVRFAAAPAAFDSLFRKSIPVAFGPGTKARVASSLSFKDWRIDWRPALELVDIQARARDAAGKILGIDARKFAEALTEVGRVELRDLRIFGEPWAPSVEVGNTLRNVVAEALRRKGEKALAAELEKGAKKLEEAIGPDATKALRESPAGALVDEGKKAVGGALEGGIRSLFGGEEKKKKDEK